jgi:fatty-acyl-CoA synthase
VLGTHQTHGTLVLMPEFEPNLCLDLIAGERVQFTLAVPTMLIALLEAQRAAPRDLASLEVVISGGAVVPVEVVKRVKAEFGVDFAIIFGQTETSPVVTSTRLDDSPEDSAESLGRPLPRCEVKIVDVATGATVPVGATGELCTRGYLTMREYYDMPEATARTLDDEGWLHTGDLCAMDARGYCYIRGRLKDMIIRGGENIYPREIEEVLFRHPDVAEVAVVGVPDARWGEQAAAFVRLVDGRAPRAGELVEFVRAHLAPHKAPKIWCRVDAYPLTPSGKIQKFRLAELYAAGDLRDNLS